MTPAPPPDPILPAISTAWDGDATGAVLNRAFREVTVRSCEPRYVKYKPLRYCRIQYQVELENENGNILRTPAHVSIYPIRRAEKLAARNGVPDGAEGPHSRQQAAYIPELGAIVQLFPVDLAMPGLEEAARAEPMTHRIQRALGERVGGALEGCDVELVRYKAEKRAVLRYSLQGSRVPSVYGKMRSDGGEAISCVAETLSRAGVPMPEPLAYLPDLRLFLQAEGAGERLADLRGSADFANWMPAVAEALVRLHEAEIGDLPRFSASAEIDELQESADTVAALLPHLRATAKSLGHRIAARLLSVKGDPAPIHGSFHDDQVLVGDASVTLIDLDGAAIANPLSDVGHFLSYLSAEGASGAYELFLMGYCSARQRWTDDYLVFEAASLLRWATLPFRELRPDWPRAVERRVHLASERLNDA